MRGLKINPNKAIEYLRESFCNDEDHDFEELHNGVLDLAIKALEKQIPKITTETQELMEVEYICPDCDCTNGSRFKFCWNCGQSIIHVY